MITITSNIDGKQFSLLEVKDALEPLGFVMNGNWEYDHAYIDYKMGDNHGDQQYLRIPLKSLQGDLGSDNARIMIGTPFLLDHEFKNDVDEEGNIGSVSASFNQFKPPEDEDAPFPEEYIGKAKDIMSEAEAALANEDVI
ncbi:YugN family protein [Bacillus massilinigeriensis]|uniref:YugN family protein n=1 Tax=Bacillus mediterraneensis TaxID=1805474 RepID=UPI0008F912CA|nr:YugN family protein [Bacillus mediterraneensis]